MVTLILNENRAKVSQVLFGQLTVELKTESFLDDCSQKIELTILLWLVVSKGHRGSQAQALLGRGNSLGVVFLAPFLFG